MKRILSLLVSIVFLLNTTLAYTLTVLTNGTGFTVTFDSQNEVQIVKENAQINRWEVKSGDITLTENKFTMPENNVEIDGVMNSYTIKYNANGGINAPVEQTKSYGVDATISGNIPTREGYTFVGWSRNPNATEAEYASGATYSLNSSTILYAVWTVAYTYTVTTTVNLFEYGSITGGGSKAEGSTVILEATANSGYKFKDWTVVSGGVTLNSTTETITTFTMPANAVSIIGNFEVDIASLMPEFTYEDLNGNILAEGVGYRLKDDGIVGGVQNWRIEFLESGTVTFSKVVDEIDVFCVGGGGGGASDSDAGCGGGGGGLTATATANIENNTSYTITVGAGGTSNNDGQATTAFDCTAGGGSKGLINVGGAGGSGGGGNGGNGGSDGYAGTGNSSMSNSIGGEGQNFTTREFATSVTNSYIVGGTAFASNWLSLTSGGTALTPIEGTIYSVMTEGDYWYRDFIWNGTEYEETDIAKVYSGGGGGHGYYGPGTGGAGGGGNGPGGNGTQNTGGGGGGYWEGTGGTGGSGIVVIRNARKINETIASQFPQFRYYDTSGNESDRYELLDDGLVGGVQNWRIRFLESGTVTFSRVVDEIDVFLVGAGGSGNGAWGAGGGSGYITTQGNVSVEINDTYDIVVGVGASGANGGNTTAFNLTAQGGTKGSDYSGGSGASGGGGAAQMPDANGGNGGSNGSNGNNGGNGSSYGGGAGQGEYTYEFYAIDGDTSATLYAGGGAGYGGTGGAGGGGTNGPGSDNTGGGGGGSDSSNYQGGSGIVVIRNSRQ